MLGFFYRVISVFCLHRALDKSHMWKLLVYEKNLCSWKNKKRKKVLGEKKKKNKRRPREEGKSTTLSSKENIPLYSVVKATGTGGAGIG